MKKVMLFALLGIFLSVPALAQDKLLVIYLYHKNSPYLEKINNKIMKNKYLAKRIKKSFDFRKIQLDLISPKKKGFILLIRHLEKFFTVLQIFPSHADVQILSTISQEISTKKV